MLASDVTEPPALLAAGTVALVGALAAQAMLARMHDRQLAAIGRT
jgi:hypothetical protein